MSGWNAKYRNDFGEYEITFYSKDYEKTKAVEKVCCAIMDGIVKSSADVATVVRCKDCKHWNEDALACDTLPWASTSEHANWYAEDFCSYGERRSE